MNINTDFKEQIYRLLPEHEADEMLHAIEASQPAVALRFNAEKGGVAPSSLEQVPWCEMGTYLSERPQFTFDPHFHAGNYYVQDPSSMFIYHIIKSLISHPVKYLDLCAAPGGKTTAAQQALPPSSIIVANEIVPQRAHILRENIIKWGCDNCMVTNDSPSTLGTLISAFDIIAADVPCSGEGMFRKDDEAVNQWSLQLVNQCAARQRSIVKDIWPALKPGGLLIYSTCTFNIEENERVAQYVAHELGATFVDIPVLHDWGITGNLDGSGIACYRFLPHKSRGEGLFVCVMRKKVSFSPSQPGASKSFKPKKSPSSAAIPSNVLGWINGDYQFTDNNGVITATKKDFLEFSASTHNKLRIIKSLGTEIATTKGKKLVPSHELAMSAHLADNAFNRCEVDYRTALAYLRGEAITIDAPQGVVLITYNGAILGFVNNLGNRANNLYPKNWRILSSHLPDSTPIVINHK